MINLSIIIVNYNTKDFLEKCLESISSSFLKNIQYEIIVIDNASSDGSPSEILKIKNKASNVKIILNKKNVGFSKANNQGIKISERSRYFLFLNPDTIMEKNTIEEIIKFMDSHKYVGSATCKLILPNGKMDDAVHRGFPTPWNAFCHFSGLSRIFPKSQMFSGYNLGWMDMNKAHEIDALAGAFMMVRKEAGDEVKWWDEDYFFYGEDIDFCYKLKQKGWKIYYVPMVSAIHHKGVSGGIKSISKNISTASEDTRKLATKWRFEAMRIFYKKHYKDKYPSFINLFINKGINLLEKFA